MPDTCISISECLICTLVGVALCGRQKPNPDSKPRVGIIQLPCPQSATWLCFGVDTRLQSLSKH